MKNIPENSAPYPSKFCDLCGTELNNQTYKCCPSCGNEIIDYSISATQSFMSAASKGRNEPWRYVVGIVVALIIWQLIGPLPFLGACGALSIVEILGFNCDLNHMSITGPSLVPGFFLAMLTFVIGLIGLRWTIKWIHRRGLLQVLTGRSRFDLNRFFFSSIVVLAFSFLSLLAGLSIGNSDVLGGQITRNSVGIDWILLSLTALMLVPIQAGTEELFFRGYVLQGLTRLTKNRLFLALATSLIFTIVHIANPEPWEYGVSAYILSIFLMSLFMSLITIFDGGLELAIGFHTMNNLWSFLILGLEKAVIPTTTLFTLNVASLDTVNAIIPGIVQFALLFGIFSWRYRWFNKNISSTKGGRPII